MTIETPGAAFLLTQLGSHAAARFAERLQPLGLSPPHAGVLWALARSAPLSQQRLAQMLKIHPSRLVALVDELESLGLMERRDNRDDRRAHDLHLTDAGRASLKEIGKLSRRHAESLLAALDPAEVEQLTTLLRRLADQQGLTPGIHPGFSAMKKK